MAKNVGRRALWVFNPYRSCFCHHLFIWIWPGWVGFYSLWISIDWALLLLLLQYIIQHIVELSRTSIYTMYSLSLKLSRVLSIILTNPFKCQVALRFWIFGKANMRMTCIYVPICGGQEVWCCSSVWLYFYLPFLMIRSITCFSNFWQFRKN